MGPHAVTGHVSEPEVKVYKMKADAALDVKDFILPFPNLILRSDSEESDLQILNIGGQQ